MKRPRHFSKVKFQAVLRMDNEVCKFNPRTKHGYICERVITVNFESRKRKLNKLLKLLKGLESKVEHKKNVYGNLVAVVTAWKRI